jgi:hypothetical protein
MQDADPDSEPARQGVQQLVRTGQFTRDRVAHSYRERRRRRLAFLDHIEVVIERRDFVHFRHRHLQLGRESG